MKIHVLSGDSLVEPFKNTNIEGEIIICRECLVDGDLIAENFADFWNVREQYLSDSYVKPDNFYQEKVKAEFDKLLGIADGSEINLWFEYEAFCQVNLWFCLSILKEKEAEIFIVYPYIESKNDLWKGFGYLDEKDLIKSYKKRIGLKKEDLELGAKLFKAFQNREFETLKTLSINNTDAFPTLKEISQALSELETRPKNVVRKILENGEKSFGNVFRIFNETEQIYGFGDLQVKKIYDELVA